MKLKPLEQVVRAHLDKQLAEIRNLLDSAVSCISEHDYEQCAARIELIRDAAKVTEFELRIYGVTTREKERTSQAG